MDELISRQAVIDCYKKWQPYMSTRLLNFEKELYCIPSVTPSYNSIKTELKPSGDCISRQAVLDAIDAYKYLDGNDAIYRLKQWLNEQECVQPKMGRWIEHFDESGKWYECDQCHTDWGGTVNYCPNCVAKM